MVKKTSLIVAAIVALTITSSQEANGAPAPPVNRGGSKAVRETHQIRSSVNQLLGWRVGVSATVFRSLTFSESAALADALGLGSIEGVSSQKVSPQIDKDLDFHLSASEIATVKARLTELNLKMPAYHVDAIPSDEASSRKLFAFVKEMGAETIVTSTMPSSLSAVDKLAAESGVNVAIESSDDPKALMRAIGGLSPRIGVNADLGKWIEHGIRPVEGLSLLKDRLMAVRLRDRNALGANGRDVRLGTGVAGVQQFLLQIAQQEPPPQEQPDKCVNCSRPYGGTKPLFIVLDLDPWQITTTREPQVGTSGNAFADLWQAAEDFEKVVRPAMGYRVEQDARLIPITPTDRIPADVKTKIEAALPKALVAPKKPRKLLVVDVAPAGAYYHDTAAHANFAISKMAASTGAFEAVFSNDLNNLKYPDILQFDAVFLNSGDGPVFADPDVLNGLIRFVRGGGGVAGLHGASYASMDVPEFGELIGAQSGPHHVEKATLKIDDPDSPLTKQFASSPLTAELGGKGFVYTDEFYHFLPSGPYSREKLHVLISIDADQSDLSPWHVRPDRDYGLVWIKSYGHGRVFNCAIGHTPTLFETPALSQMILNAIQFVLGDLPANTTPSAMLAKKRR
ncbi:MAG TPA: ThuA domain-containing protein [Edaphobacter sp.]|nr:ThuA domain-containing protein [Edaphobacter sp.]